MFGGGADPPNQDVDQTKKQSVPSNEPCGFCGQNLTSGQAAVRAMGKLFHVTCFTCSQCKQQLQGQKFYSLKGVPFCERCHTERLERCHTCGQPIRDRILRAIGKAYHPQCFTCAICNCSLESCSFILDQANRPHCVADYHKKYAPKCFICMEPIVPEPGKDETKGVVVLDRSYHVRCYKCEDCGRQLSVEADENGCFPLNRRVLCRNCHANRTRS